MVKYYLLAQIPDEPLSKFSRIIISIIILLWDFFTPPLADGFSLEPERQQVSSSLQDSS